MDFFEDLLADRIGGSAFGKDTEVYKFDKIKKAKAQAKSAHPDIPLIDLGVGEPDDPADSGVVDMLSAQAGKPENRWYADNGIEEYQAAAARYLETVYGVKGLDASVNILHGIGSKPILAMLPVCLINPGDITLATVPGYPVSATYTKYMGGEVYPLPLRKENAFFPDFSAIPRDILKRAKLLYINYPNNPTGQTATKEFFKEVVDFAYRNQIAVVQDAAYAALTYDGCRPLSFLSVDGASEVGVEVHSMSKAFHMTGWRLAFAAGSAKLIKAYGTVKDNTDSGQFRAIQKAGIYALGHTEITERLCEKYSRRLDLLVKTLKEIGFDALKPKGTFYCYVPCPRGTASGLCFHSAEETADYLIRDSLISAVPWDDAGAYLRFSVTYEANGEEEEKRIMKEMKRRFLDLNLVF